MNREGTFSGLELIFRQWQFKLTARYVESFEINDVATQDDMNWWQVTVETLYVEF